MGSVELAQAFENALGNESWVMLTDLLRSQGLNHLTIDDVRAFHQVVPEGVTRRTVTYGTGSGRSLNGTLFSPTNSDGALRSAVVFVHGGGWVAGHSVMHDRHAAHLAADGFVALTINYRLVAEAPWPAALDDVRAAVRYVRDHAVELGVDPSRIAVSGASAGGHLAELVAAQSTPDSDVGVAAAVLWYPVVDVSFAGVAEPIRSFLVGTFDAMLGGTPREHATPATYVSASHPPVLTLVGVDDAATPKDDTVAFHALLDAAGVRNEIEVVPGVGHGFEIDPRQWEWSYVRMRDFLRRELA